MGDDHTEVKLILLKLSIIKLTKEILTLSVKFILTSPNVSSGQFMNFIANTSNTTFKYFRYSGEKKIPLK